MNRRGRRHFSGDRLVVASHNAGKVRELQALLQPFEIACISAGSLGLPEPDETGVSFVENAELKAHAAAQAAELPALADDSGLTVDALAGAPGIYSARWAGSDRDFAGAMAEVENQLQAANATTPKARCATFVCALTLAWPNGHAESFLGRAPGHLIWPPRGSHGFGYDPMFVPAGESRTFGEMPEAEKLPLTHRADAFRQLIDACFHA